MSINDLTRLFPEIISKLIWKFDINDSAVISSIWPCDSPINELAQDLHYVHSFSYKKENHDFLCVLHPAKNTIYISTDIAYKDKLYDLIKDL